ncbi:flagellar motor protein MotB [Enterobacteriaceae bacterium 4M9]|nr:flagellar motor protein MotB [Enterobacteriaceae bacterium 4M9]
MKKKDHPVIIVKKRKSHGHGHHGGSWKIAYADFMTAMMAFFLVMWLLSMATPEERQQIAEYFKMPLKAAMSNGDRFSLSDSVIPGGGDDMLKVQGEVQKRRAESSRQRDMQGLSRVRERLDQLIKNDPRLRELQPNLKIKLLDDGLRIQIVDSQQRPMFRSGNKEVEPYMRDILRAIAPVLNDIPNRISLSGHTDDTPFMTGERGYSNWELSADRANASRRELVTGGLASDKVLRVVGMADSMNLTNVSGDDPSNRRISILILTKDKENEILNENNGSDVQNVSLNEDDPNGVQQIQESVAPAM